MAEQTQTQQAPTPVNFDDVSLAHLTFNETFRVTRGAASQVVLGLKNMLGKLSTPSNDYQKSIYPQLSKLTEEVVERYSQTFLQVTDSVSRQVYGANLNGHRNDGSLYRSVNSGINRSLTYGYAQFGQLIKVLTSRLRFITSRDAQTVQRYKESQQEAVAYVALQTQCNEFLTYLSSVNDEWTKIVDVARQQHNIQKTRQTRQPRQQTTPSTEGQTQRPRKQYTQRPRTQQNHQQQDGPEWVSVRVRRTDAPRPTGSKQVNHHRVSTKTT
jgi:hypothetical protein